MKNTYLLLFASFLLISCSGIRNTRNHLNEIETFINARPDSALFLLDSLEISLPFNKSIRAHHALLHAQAKDKCFIDETNDSILLDVADYYRSKRDIPKLFKAYYYLGRIQYNAGNHTESIISYTKAEELIDKVKDDFSKGLLYAQLGMLHRKHYDYQNSLKAYNLAQEYYHISNHIPHQYFTKLNIGHIYHELRNYDSAENLYKEVLIWSQNNQYYELYQESIDLLITLYDETGRLSESIDLINSELNGECINSLPIIQTRAYQMALDGNRDAIDYLHEECTDLISDFADSVNNFYYECCIHKVLGNYKEALQIHEKLCFIQDTLKLSSFRQSLLASKNSYLELENSLMTLQIKATKSRSSLFLIAALIIIASTITYMLKRINKHKRQMVYYVEAAAELEKTLIQKMEEIEAISHNLGVADRKLQKSSEYIASILGKQYALLNKLTSTYYETHGCNKDKEAIYKEVSKEIERLGSDKTCIQQLEELVNRHKNNVMMIIREKLPFLQEMDFRLLCYWCVGFSAKAISIFTGDSTNNIYVKKSRIKNEIAKLDKDTKDFILSSIYSQYNHI